MNKKQVQNKLLRTLYRPKPSKIINSKTLSQFDEIDLFLDKKIGHVIGKRSRKTVKDNDEKEDS